MEKISLREAKINRDKAMAVGEPVYVGNCHNCGITKKYVANQNCVICHKQNCKRRRDHPKNKAKQSILNKQKHRANIEVDLLRRAKYRTKKSGLEFNIDIKDIIIPEFCPILGIPIIIGKEKVHANSPSIDRIDSNNGYMKGNVQVISYKANACKGNLSLQEMIQFGEWARDRLEGNNK